MSEPAVTVSVREVLNLIKYHADGDFEEAKKAAFKIAEELQYYKEGELSLYIYAQYGLGAWTVQ